MLFIYQGNDKNFVFFRKDYNGVILKTRPQAMWFTVRKRGNKESEYIFQKTLINGITQGENGEWTVSVKSNDTATIKPDVYLCDVKIKDENGNQITIVKPQDFVVREVATTISNQGG